MASLKRYLYNDRIFYAANKEELLHKVGMRHASDKEKLKVKKLKWSWPPNKSNKVSNETH